MREYWGKYRGKVENNVDDSNLGRIQVSVSASLPVAQRAPGVIAVVGNTPNGANGGQADKNKPYRIDTRDQALDLFAKKDNLDASGNLVGSSLYWSLVLAMQQHPKPSKIYGVRVDGDKYADAMTGLEAAEGVTFVSLANETAVGSAAGNGTRLQALKKHVEHMSAQGQRRIGVAMINNTKAKSPNYVDEVENTTRDLRSDSGRMVMIAARGAVEDAATAAMSAIAGYEPHISIALKRIRGVSMPLDQQYSASEIKGLSEKGIVPIIEPIVGSSLHFAGGRCYTSDASMLYIDIVRTLDDIEFKLRAGLIGLGGVRIAKGVLTFLKSRVEGMLAPLKSREIIKDYNVDIPVLDALSIPASTRTPTDNSVITTSRANHSIGIIVSISYGPAVHRLRVTLA